MSSDANKIPVGIIMGSDSDLEVMGKAADVLDAYGVKYEMRIISAHRQPEDFYEWAKEANARYHLIIAGAGKAAALPGMTAAIFDGPVIGVPMKTSDLGGVDSLYSIVQMPGGVPVATVAINGGENAGLLAVRILALSNGGLMVKLRGNRAKNKQAMYDKDTKLVRVGHKEYLDDMKKG